MFTPISCLFKLHCTYAALDSWACQPAAHPTRHRRTAVTNTTHQGVDPGPASVAFNQQSFLTGDSPLEEVQEAEPPQISVHQMNGRKEFFKFFKYRYNVKTYMDTISALYQIINLNLSTQ